MLCLILQRMEMLELYVWPVWRCRPCALSTRGTSWFLIMEAAASGKLPSWNALQSRDCYLIMIKHPFHLCWYSTNYVLNNFIVVCIPVESGFFVSILPASRISYFVLFVHPSIAMAQSQPTKPREPFPSDLQWPLLVNNENVSWGHKKSPGSGTRAFLLEIRPYWAMFVCL